MNELVTYLPSAGNASRLKGIPKFYLPINENNNLINYHVENLNQIKNNQIVIATNSTNYGLLKESFKNEKVIEIASNSMVETVYKSLNLNKDLHLVVMPDTYFNDYKVMKQKIDKINDSNIDIVLGLWKIREDQFGKLGQCKLKDDRVEIVIDKDPDCKEHYAWGTILWKTSFNKYIQPSDNHFGTTINRAIQNGLKVGYVISDSDYFDCGTFYEYKKLINSFL